MNVTWVTGRKKHLAHALAMHCADIGGKKWTRLSQRERDTRVEEAFKKLTEWSTNDVLAEFQHRYGEKEAS